MLCNGWVKSSGVKKASFFISAKAFLNFFLSNSAMSNSLASISPLRNHAEIAW
jgi:hypothetical protein